MIRSTRALMIDHADLFTVPSKLVFSDRYLTTRIILARGRPHLKKWPDLHHEFLGLRHE
jgi:hypothetical protein